MELTISVDVGKGAVSVVVSLKETVGAEAGVHPIRRSPIKNDTARIFICSQDTINALCFTQVPYIVEYLIKARRFKKKGYLIYIRKRLGENMIPAGYMYKRIAPPEGLNCRDVTKIYSVSSCLSKDFTDYIPYWKHNKYWFFNNPGDMDIIIHEQKIPDKFELLFYELYENEYDEEKRTWREIVAEETFGYQVKIPAHKDFLGFDIVSYSAGTSHECSPLSCNLLCREVEVNEYCLLDDFEEAIQLAVSLNEKKAEPGPYRIIAVNRIGIVA